MKNLINIEAFRRHYDEMIQCKTAFEANADSLNRADEKSVETLADIINEYGREMVKKQIAIAILQNQSNYDETLCSWAKKVQIPMFIYETEDTLPYYIPERLSEQAIENIASKLIEKEKHREFIKSSNGTKHEVIKSEEHYKLLCSKVEGIPVYSYAYILSTQKGYLPFSDNDISDTFFSYAEANAAYKQAVEEDRRSRLVKEKLTKTYHDFKETLLSKTPSEVFGACHRIAAVEEVYFYLTEKKVFTPEEENYILDAGDFVLTDLADEWFECGDWSEELSDIVNSNLEQYLQEYEAQLSSSSEKETEEDVEEEL